MRPIARRTRFFDFDSGVMAITIPIHRYSDDVCNIANPGGIQSAFIDLKIFRKGTDGNTYLIYRPQAYDPLKGVMFILDSLLSNQPKGLYTAQVLVQGVPIKPEYTIRVGRRGYTLEGYERFGPYFPTGQDENPSPAME